MIRQAVLSHDEPMELTTTDRRMEGADQSDHAREVLELRDEIRRTEDLVRHFRTTMGEGFFLTIQNAAHLDGLRKELGHKLNGPETEAQRQSRLDSEADELMDRVGRVLMAGRNEDRLVEDAETDAEAVEANGPKRAKTIDELEGDDDDFFRRFAAGQDSLLG